MDPVCPADMAGADTADLEALAAWAAGPKAGLSPARREAAAAVLRERSAKLLALDEANHRARAAASAVDERTAGATAAKARVVLLRDERSEERGRWGMFQ